MRTSEQPPRIVITRTPDAAAELITELTAELSNQRNDGKGACSDGNPEILCVPVHEAEAVNGSLRERALELLVQVRAGEFEALTLTSKNGVRAFALLVRELGIDLAQMLNPVHVACVGESTANELQQLGVRVDFVPSVQDAMHMVREWPSTHVAQRILCVQGANARPTLEQGLKSLGHSVTSATVYTMSEFPARAPLSARSPSQTQAPVQAERDFLGLIPRPLTEVAATLHARDVIIATAPSLLGELFSEWAKNQPGEPSGQNFAHVIAIGATTLRTAEKIGCSATLSATPQPADLARATLKFLKNTFEGEHHD